MHRTEVLFSLEQWHMSIDLHHISTVEKRRLGLSEKKFHPFGVCPNRDCMFTACHSSDCMPKYLFY